jgi:hypothetical protein
MGNRIVVRKIQTSDSVVYLAADDYGKSFFEYDAEPELAVLWTDIIGDVAFEGIGDDVLHDGNGVVVLDSQGVPRGPRVFVLEDA